MLVFEYVPNGSMFNHLFGIIFPISFPSELQCFWL
ncbi:hypothetical protein LINPERPRIM_LOCUS17591 [Linum perenne]